MTLHNKTFKCRMELQVYGSWMQQYNNEIIRPYHITVQFWWFIYFNNIIKRPMGHIDHPKNDRYDKISLMES